jgi:hypothetical protein
VRGEEAPFDTGADVPFVPFASFLPVDLLATFDGVFGLAQSSVTAARLFLPAEELDRPLFSARLGVEELRFFSPSTREAMPRRTAAQTIQQSIQYAPNVFRDLSQGGAPLR